MIAFGKMAKAIRCKLYPIEIVFVAHIVRLAHALPYKKVVYV